MKEYLEFFKKKGVRVKIIDLPTTMKDFEGEHDWIMDMINNIIIEVYISIAEQERETILQRQAEGIAAAKAKGKHVGRPLMELPKEWARLYKQWKLGEIKDIEFMKKTDRKKPAFYKKVKEYEAHETR